jgi:hypothetical protein
MTGARAGGTIAGAVPIARIGLPPRALAAAKVAEPARHTGAETVGGTDTMIGARGRRPTGARRLAALAKEASTARRTKYRQIYRVWSR